MALAKGINSYVDVSEAEAYFSSRLDAAAWAEATPEQKEQSLVTATSMLDELVWDGVAAEATQELAFPRVGSFFDPRLGHYVYMTKGEIPKRLLKGTFELAYHLLNNDGLLDDSGSVDSLSVGGVSLTKIRMPGKFPSVVLNLIKPMKVNGGMGGNMWWRAN